MQNVDWLLENASIPIRYNISCSEQRQSAGYEEELLQFPEVRYWLAFLVDNKKQNTTGLIHGSHDYRFENILGKLTQLGLHRGIRIFRDCCEFYVEFLRRQIELNRDTDLTFSKIYSYYDYELIIATFLSLAGYIVEPAVRHVMEKRISLLYSFTKEERYDIYVDGSKYPGVKKEWENHIINPSLYEDGNIGVPTIHDYVLFSASFEYLDEQSRKKVDTIVDWIFGEPYKTIKGNYGYFYAPKGSYSTKAICHKLNLPDLLNIEESEEGLLYLVQRVYLLSHFRTCNTKIWFKEAVSHLQQFGHDSGRYEFPKTMLSEKRDAYWIFSGHMGMGENRRKRQSVEIESTYWMEQIHKNIDKWTN